MCFHQDGFISARNLFYYRQERVLREAFSFFQYYEALASVWAFLVGASSPVCGSLPAGEDAASVGDGDGGDG